MGDFEGDELWYDPAQGHQRQGPAETGGTDNPGPVTRTAPFAQRRMDTNCAAQTENTEQHIGCADVEIKAHDRLANTASKSSPSNSAASSLMAPI